MEPDNFLAERFERQRERLQGVAYRMLGSLSEAEDAVQEAWVRLDRADTSGVANLEGWLTTVVARVCLDMLRSRKARREQSLEASPQLAEPSVPGHAASPEHEAVLADTVGLALLVVLETLAPAERLAFVLHDLFAVSFEEIAEIVGRSPAAARQLASRARRRVQGQPAASDVALQQQRAVVDSFLAALRGGDIEGLLRVLDPELVVHADLGQGRVREIRGAKNWLKGAVQFASSAKATQAALIDGAVGLILAPHGRLLRVLRLTIADGKVVSLDVISDPARLAALEISVL